MADYFDFDFGYGGDSGGYIDQLGDFSAGGQYPTSTPSSTPSYDTGYVDQIGDYSAGGQYPTSQNYGGSSFFGDTSQMSYAPWALSSQPAWYDAVFQTQTPQMSMAPQQATPTFTPGGGPSASLGNQIAGLAPATSPALGNAGVTGDFGNLGQAAERALGGIEAWGQRNPRLASALTQGVGLLANASAQRRANDLMKQQLAMQQRQNEQQQQVFAKNTGIADMRNQLAQQQINQALSLYNPQELGQRGMAQQQATTGRQLQQLEQQMASRGYSPADIAAARRRAQVGGALNATQGYMQGYDTGRSAQQGALSSAVGLGQQYGAAPTPADMSQAATALSTMGTQAGQNYASMLGGLLGNPTYEATKRTQESSAAATRRRLGLPAQ